MVADRVYAAVRAWPDRVAILSDQGSVTYGELWRRSGAAARQLRDLGCGAGSTVGVLSRPSPEGVVAMLAALRVGSAYLGMCPSLPPARVNAMVKDCGARFVLHSDDIPPDFLTATTPVAVRVSDEAEHGAHLDDADLPRGHPWAPVAVIYTSGSTGSAKGVVIPERALRNRIDWGQRTYPLGAGDRVLHHTRYIYDFSAWEVLAPLVHGSTLVTVPFRNYPDAEELVQAIRTFEVTAVHFVPSVLAGVARRESFRGCDSLTTVFSGGEALSQRLAAEVTDACPATLYNQYGPTETCVDSAWFRYDRRTAASAGTVPIGRPIDRTYLYVLDRELRPVGDGGTGELYIGGAGLAVGYLGRAALTAERFVADPFRGGGARMYRTGDLARVLSDGSLRFVGRADWQINLRGVRLEPAEVEAELESHPGVARAVVALEDDPDQGPHLVALIVPEEGEPVTRGELRDHARATLPAAAVPDRFYTARSAPLLPNGKVDRAAVGALVAGAEPLPAAAGAAPESGGVAESGGAAVPAPMVAIWREVLGVDEIGPHDDFFELGGHSLLAVELVSTINERLHTDVALVDFFESPTLAAVAAIAGAPGSGEGRS